MSVIKDYIFKRNGIKPNFILYGAANVISSQAILEGVYSTLESSDIIDFKIIGSDVFVTIKETTTKSIVSMGTIGCTSCVITAPNLYVGGNCFKDSTTLAYFSCESDTLGSSVFYGCTSLSVNDIHIPNVTTINSSLLYNNKSGGTFSAPEATSLVAYAINQGGANTVGGFNIDIPKCISAGAYSLHSVQGTINAKKLTNLGSPSINTFALYGIKSGSIVNVNDFLRTNNSGGADADLVYAKGRGAIINFYDDLGNYVSTL